MAMSDRTVLAVILLICAIYRAVYFDFGIHTLLYNSDSVTYFAPVDLMNGVVDLYRTPVYPYLLQFLQWVSADALVRNLVIVQHAVLLLSIVPFYSVARHVIAFRPVAIAATVFYGCWHHLLDQSVNINPEGLCIAGSTLLMWLVVKYVQRPGRIIALSLGLFTLLMIMLKPTYLLSVGVIGLFFAMRLFLYRDEKAPVLWGAVGLGIAAIGITGYCEMNSRHNGVFTISKVTWNNSISNIITSEAYRLGGDAELIEVIDSSKDSAIYLSVFLLNNAGTDHFKNTLQYFPKTLAPTENILFCASIPDTENFAYARIDAFIAKSQATTEYVSYLLKRTVRTLLEYWLIWTVLFVQLIIVGWAFFRFGNVAWTLTFCILSAMAQFLTLMLVIGQFTLDVNAPITDMGRLLIPNFPFLIIVVGSMVGIVCSSISKERFVETVSRPQP